MKTKDRNCPVHTITRWALDFALKQPLRGAALVCSASGISKQLEVFIPA
ncbi:MAG: hypothetical protein LBJ00_00545 [Planctomycetaceae bacterium]|nr:hypothetical protein [Planctomycetaceae bacterium]